MDIRGKPPKSVYILGREGKLSYANHLLNNVYKCDHIIYVSNNPRKLSCDKFVDIIHVKNDDKLAHTKIKGVCYEIDTTKLKVWILIDANVTICPDLSYALSMLRHASVRTMILGLGLRRLTHHYSHLLYFDMIFYTTAMSAWYGRIPSNRHIDDKLRHLLIIAQEKTKDWDSLKKNHMPLFIDYEQETVDIVRESLTKKALTI
tara:strand:+ start:34137 stop:34748 length:612 start_codon:yes stop_codon:yes gene_type:complete